MTLYEYDPEEPYELFFRLNQAYALTPSEKRNALYGRARDQVRSVVEHLESQGLLVPQRIGFSNARLGYDDVLARTCLALQVGDLREPIDTGRVESFYRHSHFDDHVLNAVAAGGGRLADMCAAVGGKVKFNKATLFTWLVFCAQVDTQHRALPEFLVAEFERFRAAVKSGHVLALSPEGKLAAAINIYNDRASYRVADTQSVLLRDLILNIYAAVLAPSPSPMDRDLSSLASRLPAAEDSALEELRHFIAQSEWGRLW